MAYIVKPRSMRLQDDEEEMGQPAGQAPQGPGITPGTQSTGGLSPTQPAAQTPAVDNGRRFPLMGKYLDANKGMGVGMAGAVAGNVNHAADTAESAINKVKTDFENDVNKGSPLGTPGKAAVPRDPNAKPGSKNNQNQQGGAKSNRWGTPATPYTPPWGANYQNLDNPLSYTGPNSMTEQNGYSDAIGAIGRGVDMAGATGSQGGIEALLRDSYGGPYSEGQSRLDAALVGGSGSNAIYDAASRFPQLSRQFGLDTKASLDRVKLARQNVANMENKRLELVAQREKARANQEAREQKALAEREAYEAWMAEQEAARQAEIERNKQKAADKAGGWMPWTPW